MDEEKFAEVTAALRAGVNDAYRLGLGAAIEILLEFRNRTTDPLTFDAALAQLHELSIRMGDRIRS